MADLLNAHPISDSRSQNLDLIHLHSDEANANSISFYL
jgi:hypothetical protein